METKFCKKCGQTKPISGFKIKNGKVVAPCRDCCNKRERERRAEDRNPELLAAKLALNKKRKEQFDRGIRECSECHQEKPLCEYFVYKTGYTHYVCKVCEGLLGAKWQREHPQQRIVQRKRQQKNNPKSFLLASAKKRAKLKNIEWDISHDDIIVPKFCPILNIPLSVGGGTSHDSPSIDRINNDIGYCRGNVIVISARANRIKNDSIAKERDQLVNFYSNVNDWLSRIHVVERIEENKQKYSWYGIKNPEELSKIRKLERKNNISKVLYQKAKERAKASNIPFDLDSSDIIIPKYCPVFGFELEVGPENKQNSPTIDRIIPEKGYVKGNCVVISYRANRIKNDATLEELIKIRDFYKKLGENQTSNELVGLDELPNPHCLEPVGD